MLSASTYSYLSIPLDLVVPGEWTLPDGSPLVDQNEFQPSGEISLQRRLRMDPARLRAACGLGPDAELTATCLWYSQGTTLRGCGSPSPILPGSSEEQEISVLVQLESANLGEKLELTTIILLVNPGSSSSLLAPSRRWSVLWNDVRLIRLEREQSLFPIVPLPFITYPHLDPGALWLLDWTPSEVPLDVQFTAAVRVLLNSDHPAYPVLIGEKEDLGAGPHFLRTALRHGVASELAAAVLLRAEELHSTEFQTGSIGDVLKKRMEVSFPGLDVKQIADLAQNNPHRFHTRIQGEAGLFAPEE